MDGSTTGRAKMILSLWRWLTFALNLKKQWQWQEMYLASWKTLYFYRAPYAVVRCMSVCPSVIFVYLSKGINVLNISSNFFSPSGSPTILVFLYQTLCQYSDRNSLKGASNAGGYEKNRDFPSMSRFIWEMIQDSYNGILCDLSNGVISNDLGWPVKVTTFSASDNSFSMSLNDP